MFSCFRRCSLVLLVIGLLATGGCTRTAKAADPVDSMLVHAVAIADSLAGDKMDGVNAHALGLRSDATTLGKPGEKIVSAAKTLEKTNDIEHARDAFGKMSEALVAYLDAAKRKPGSGLRIAFCPMVLKPWIQKDGAIQNPYYGSEMLTCGSFRP